MDKQKVLLVGRHTPVGLEDKFEIVEQRNVQFPAEASECVGVLMQLLADAQEANAAVLLQMTPGQVAIALAHIAAEGSIKYQAAVPVPPIGVVISRLGPREAGVSREFWLNDPQNEWESVQEAIKFANARAEVEVLSQEGHLQYRITVDPIKKFEFDHVEWL